MKITVNGEVLDAGFDLGRVPMSTALEIERAWGRRYVEWEAEILAGSAEATCVLVWLCWKRDGRDVALADIISGDAGDLDFSEAYRSFTASFVQQQKAEAAENPTSGDGEPRTAPDGTDTTQPDTKGSSPKSSM